VLATELEPTKTSSGRRKISFKALLAALVAARAVPLLALWYIATCTTLIIVVIDALIERFLVLLNRVILGDFRHWFIFSLSGKEIWIVVFTLRSKVRRLNTERCKTPHPSVYD